MAAGSTERLPFAECGCGDELVHELEATFRQVLISDFAVRGTPKIVVRDGKADLAQV